MKTQLKLGLTQLKLFKNNLHKAYDELNQAVTPSEYLRIIDKISDLENYIEQLVQDKK